MTIGNPLVELIRVNSTNSYAGQLYADNVASDGMVIWAHEQFAGRGQGDHAWSSEAGMNLTITVCLQPHFLPPDRQFRLNKAISLGVLDFMRSFPVHVSGGMPQSFSIKWPNDIYYGEKKTGGILIEHRIMGPLLDASFVGIGLNINQTTFAPDIPNPVSLVQIIQKETVIKVALMSLCACLEGRYQELRDSDSEKLDDEYDQNLLGYGQWRTFLMQDISTEGKTEGVDQSGRLMLLLQSGERILGNHGEVSLVK
jgi:BirA family biotin operon repressor/biotin-[acetyl-CoA-carboxylase] ligase